jgi:diguanylate cyclase (GGDEF)-like protein
LAAILLFDTTAMSVTGCGASTVLLPAASIGRLLVVDDVEDNRAILCRRFEKRNYEVVEAIDGAQALDLLSRFHFDAVLLDVMMPGVSGLDVLRSIRSQDHLRSLPVIMVTARTDSEDVVEALHLGADDYITKPVDFSIAFARVKGHVERKRSVDNLQTSNEALKRANERLREEVAARERLETQTRYLTYHDPVTGLGNCALLRDRVAQAAAYAARYGLCFALVFIDLDNFSIVNESLGHDAGDLFLEGLASRLIASIRTSDTVARLGRDEFVVLLLDQDSDPKMITSVIQKLRAAIAGKAEVKGHSVSVTSSIGVSVYPRDGEEFETLLTNAEAASQRAKEAGRDTFLFYHAEPNKRAYHKLSLLTDLREALAASQFRLVYQPQMELRSNEIVGVEALLRWDHVTRGAIPPLDFIPLAEESGLIVPIGEWVIREACRQNKAWQDCGLPKVVVSVNVSARQFMEGRLVDSVVNALKESGLEPIYLELELTESLIMRDRQRSVKTMEQLRRVGVSLSIDDFGTGYSSLAALKAFPISRLKIDKSFLDDIPNSLRDKAVVRAIVSLGRNLGLTVIAEGVERIEQEDFLRDNDCDEVQGYYLSRPLGAFAVERWLAERIEPGRGISALKNPDAFPCRDSVPQSAPWEAATHVGVARASRGCGANTN